MGEKARVTFSQTVDCPECEEPIDALFVAPEGVWEAQDLEESPTAEITCPACSHTFTEEYSGWTNFDDA